MILATDGMLSSEVSADLSAFKLQIFGDWVFLFSGTLSNADLIMEEIRLAAAADASVLSREKIQATLRSAYKKRRSQWAADRNLAPYDMEMEEFREEGAKWFGETHFAEIENLIRQDAVNFNEQVIVTGWGKSDHAAMIYSVNQYGGVSGSLDGFATMGSGGNIAQNTLMLLGCARHLPFEYALYAVAAAKFASESCEGVGKSTVMAVTHKRTEKDSAEKPPMELVQPDQIEILRGLWERYTKPKIPDEAIPHLCAIAQRAVGEVTPGAAIRMTINAMQSTSQKQG
jgi:hypothetical protein